MSWTAERSWLSLESFELKPVWLELHKFFSSRKSAIKLKISFSTFFPKIDKRETGTFWTKETFKTVSFNLKSDSSFLLIRKEEWNNWYFLPLTPFRMGFFRAAHGWALPKICHTYPTMMKLGSVIPYPKKVQKIYESGNAPLEFCWHQHFLTRNQQILLYQEIQIQIVFWYIISIYFNFSWVFIDCYNKHG